MFAGLEGVGWVGWVAGAAWCVAVTALLARALSRRGATPGPADRVTFARAVLVGGVTALVADDVIGRPLPVALTVTLAVVALVLDGVDGAIARRSGTVSDVGARFDLEVDAFLILVLSVAVARSDGAWVLAIGAMRYALWLAERWLPWLCVPVPFRYWRKVVAATQGVVLTVAVSGLLPSGVVTLALVAALALLAESFGRDVVWLWRRQRRPLGIAAAGRVRAQAFTTSGTPGR